MDVKEAIEIIQRIDPKLMLKIQKKAFNRWDSLLNQKELYYYTSTNTLIDGIITEKPEIGKEICLWATRWSHLNDSTENRIGLDLMLEMGTPKEIVDQIRANVNKNHSISLTTQFDFLPMWKMYGDNGNGVMLVFDCEKLIDKYEGRLQYCIYENDDYNKHFINTMSNLDFGLDFKEIHQIAKEYIIAVIFQLYCSIIKNKHFSYEKEVRIVGCGNPYFQNPESTVFYRYSNGKVIPHVKEFLPKNALKKVYLGPLANIELSKDTLKEFLISKNMGHVDVCTSTIPYRG